MIRFDVQFSMSNQRFEAKMRFDGNDHFDAMFDAYQEVTLYKDADPYQGAYEVTPTVDEQILRTAHRVMADDVIVKAIPKEYGLVTYDQSRTITVR